MFFGFSEVPERPLNVPEDYVWVEVDLGTYATGEEADAALAAWEPPPRAMEPEATINRTDAGEQALVGYWAVPSGVPKKSMWPWILGATAAVGLTVVVIAAAGSGGGRR